MTTAKPDNMDEYIAGFPKEVQAILEQIRATIKKAAPGAEEAISYGIPTFKLHKTNLVHFAAFKHHIGFYPTPTGGGSIQRRTFRVQNGQRFGAISTRPANAFGLDYPHRTIPNREDFGKNGEEEMIFNTEVQRHGAENACF